MISKNRTWWLWPVELILLIFDIMGLPDFIMQARLITRSGIRTLSDREKQLISDVYGELSFLDNVWMNSSDMFKFRKFAHAFVFHDSINFHNSITDSVIIHEIMHVIQYHLVGSVYITRALKAQKSLEGYQYGGPEVLYHNMLSGKSIWQYNYEQQAQIMQDLFDMEGTMSSTTDISLTSYRMLLNEVRATLLNI
ncbi:MAG: hypothetical protein HKN68_15900 [Saprospiraceae bacterium]|nr:hypothetical protein [Saprospiraceae bacterium]